MSRLRRPFLYDRCLFVTVNVLEARARLQAGEFECLAGSIAKMRVRQGFVLTAWVFLPDHWHAIIYPPHPLTISRIMKAVKVSSMVAINHRRGEQGERWQGRFFDHALRTVQDYTDTVEYIHMNPVRRGLVKQPGDWTWSSYPEYAGVEASQQEEECGLSIDRVRLPSEQRTKI